MTIGIALNPPRPNRVGDASPEEGSVQPESLC